MKVIKGNRDDLRQAAQTELLNILKTNDESKVEEATDRLFKVSDRLKPRGELRVATTQTEPE